MPFLAYYIPRSLGAELWGKIADRGGLKTPLPRWFQLAPAGASFTHLAVWALRDWAVMIWGVRRGAGFQAQALHLAALRACLPDYNSRPQTLRSEWSLLPFFHCVFGEFATLKQNLACTCWFAEARDRDFSETGPSGFGDQGLVQVLGRRNLRLSEVIPAHHDRSKVGAWIRPAALKRPLRTLTNPERALREPSLKPSKAPQNPWNP